MSGSTVSGSSIPNNWTLTSGATPVFNEFFATASAVTLFSTTGVSTTPGALAITSSNGADTVSSSMFVDISTGGNNITSVNKSIIFSGPNDTIDSAAASTVFGAGTGVGHFAISGGESSIVGGAGGFVGSAPIVRSSVASETLSSRSPARTALQSLVLVLASPESMRRQAPGPRLLQRIRLATPAPSWRHLVQALTLFLAEAELPRSTVAAETMSSVSLKAMPVGPR
jgi:hypothetical protein